jgi:cystathionine beta-lyase family protein involved in aluminum resistance
MARERCLERDQQDKHDEKGWTLVREPAADATPAGATSDDSGADRLRRCTALVSGAALDLVRQTAVSGVHSTVSIPYGRRSSLA